VRLTACGADAVGGHGQPARLEPLLQLGLGVLAPAADLGGGDDLAEHALHQRAGSVEAAVEEGGADDGLERVGEDGHALRAAAAGLALGQAQHLGQPQRQGDLVQAVLAHEVRADAREVAFVGAGEAVEQQARDGEAQHRIAEELEPFVVIGAEAAVPQRPLEQAFLCEAVAESLLQGGETGIHDGQATSPSSFPGI